MSSVPQEECGKPHKPQTEAGGRECASTSLDQELMPLLQLRILLYIHVPLVYTLDSASKS